MSRVFFPMDMETAKKIQEIQEQARKILAEQQAELESDAVNHPSHYSELPAVCSECGHPIECIDVVEHMDFLTGNIVKYAWRAGHKDGTTKLQDLKKIAWYTQRAIEKEEKSVENEKDN